MAIDYKNFELSGNRSMWYFFEILSFNFYTFDNVPKEFLL